MIKTLFPTQIWQGRLAPAKKAKSLCRDLVHDSRVLMTLDEDGWRWCEANYAGGYTSYSSMAKLHLQYAPFMELRCLIDKKVKAYVRAQGWKLKSSLEMTDCWVNVMPEGVQHSLHLHPHSVVSGTFYVQIPKGSGGLKFEDPRLGFMMAAPAINCYHQVSPTAGDLLLWESWLRHEVTTNRGRGERISVSFNYA